MPSESEGFRGVSIKKELIDAIEKFIREHPDAGYKTISEFAHDSIRHRMEQLKKLYLKISE